MFAERSERKKEIRRSASVLPPIAFSKSTVKYTKYSFATHVQQHVRLLF